MSDKHEMQSDGGDSQGADDQIGVKPGKGESSAGAYPHPRDGRPFSGGQSEQSYEGPDNPNATTE